MGIEQNNAPKPNIISKPVLNMTLVILGLIIGILLSGIYFQNRFMQPINDSLSKDSPNKSSSQSLQASKPVEFNNIVGTIQNINGDILTVQAQIFDKEKTYTVKVTKDTRLIKDETQMNLQPKEGEPAVTYTETNAKFSDLKQGDNVNAAALENIQDKNEFQAQSISIVINKTLNSPEPAQTDNAPTNN